MSAASMFDRELVELLNGGAEFHYNFDLLESYGMYQEADFLYSIYLDSGASR